MQVQECASYITVDVLHGRSSTLNSGDPQSLSLAPPDDLKAASSTTWSNFSALDSSSSAGSEKNLDEGAAVQDLYGPLLGRSATAASGAAILFGWWPRSGNWCRRELVERSTRCLPAVRLGLDFVALPDVPEVRELWAYWITEHGLASQQALWFAPRLGADAVEDPAVDVCQEILSLVEGTRQSPPSLEALHFYPMYVTPGVAREAFGRGFPLVGDAEEHPLALLSHAKAWMHPHVSGVQGASPRGATSLRDVLPPSESGARGPRGYVATSAEELREAWARLQRECPAGTRFVLKPSWGSGGCGVVFDVQEQDLDAFEFKCARSSAILEEMVVGQSPPQSPTLYMIGNMPCGSLADQVLKDDGATNVGNIYPSVLSEDLCRVCVKAAQEMNKAWGLTCNWGLDFVLDSEGMPVIVDINMGRPNGNFAVRLWGSQAVQPLSIFTGGWKLPEDACPSIGAITECLRSEGLLWSGEDGVLVYQHVPGADSAFAVASSLGDEALDVLRARLSRVMAEHFGIAA